jgi:hypothetical protein
MLLNAKIKRLKTKYNTELVDEYITKFGELEAINEIKKNISNHLGKINFVKN